MEKPYTKRKMMKPKLKIINLLGQKEQKALDLVKEIKINRTINPNFVLGAESNSIINDTIEVYELAIIELWRYAFDKTSNAHQKKKAFHMYCKECFHMLQVLPMPENPVSKIKHVLKLLTYSYLGEKCEDMKRMLIENKGIWDVEESSSNWDTKLFSTIYLAILHLTKKRNGGI